MQIWEWVTALPNLKMENVLCRSPETTPNKSVAVPWKDKGGEIPVNSAQRKQMVCCLLGDLSIMIAFQNWKKIVILIRRN